MKNRNAVLKYVVGAGALFGSVAAHAESSGAAAFASVLAEVTALEAAAWTVVVPLVIAVIGIKLFKKFANKAT